MKELPAHGTLSRAKYHHCKCLPCADRCRDYNRDARRKIAYGTWEGLSDPEPVRAHVRTLRAAGLGVRQIALLSGVSVVQIQRLVSDSPDRQQKSVQAKTVRALMAVQAEVSNRAGGASIDATGTRRRIQALVAMGFTHRVLARHIDTHELYVGDLCTAPTVSLHSAAAVCAAYDRLWNQSPAALGVTRQGIARSRARAARNGWVSPLAWDDHSIDDPAARPCVDAPEAAAEEGQLSRPERMAEARTLHEKYRLDPKAIAARLEVSERTVLRWRQAGWGEAA